MRAPIPDAALLALRRVTKQKGKPDKSPRGPCYDLVIALVWFVYNLHRFEAGYRSHPSFSLACLSLGRLRRASVLGCSVLVLGSLGPDFGGTTIVRPLDGLVCLWIVSEELLSLGP